MKTSYGQRLEFGESISSVLSKYATFHGRAPRSEYWWWVLFTILVQAATGILDAALFDNYGLIAHHGARGFTPLSSLAGLAMLLPSLAVGARRFHDMGRSAWWLLIGLTGIGAFVIFFWFMARGDEGPNRYGRDPLDRRPV
ncbi:DUF805 domain-containing protein [Ancylobacter sp. MQZ15Z-1]|uniref:DUF805 domain-containing protein n=1 Tax=Ancylobacter mangrovi TaxID=2972472 RepID=A0A9X2P9E6_9HYPH|nr:DUF805 domain-containing protein [Ancylobacter mangrovi]MCS0493795.1 DUF805 domain-containing protein [Ancylobacter mangrovi]